MWDFMYEHKLRRCVRFSGGGVGEVCSVFIYIAALLSRPHTFPSANRNTLRPPISSSVSEKLAQF
jgi:hypothetical protein